MTILSRNAIAKILNIVLYKCFTFLFFLQFLNQKSVGLNLIKITNLISNSKSK